MTPYEQIITESGPIEIMRAEQHDLPDVLSLYDESLSWLKDQGRIEQTGISRCSQDPTIIRRFGDWIAEKTVFLAVRHGQIEGVARVSARPSFPWHDKAAHVGYVETLATRRRSKGIGLGLTLLRWTELYARRQGWQALRVDCSGESGELVACYEGAGFMPFRDFMIRGRQGKLLERRIPKSRRGDLAPVA